MKSQSGITLEGPLDHLREREIELLGTLAGVIESIDEESATDARRLRDSAEDLRTMFFLLVVVGEFNAGKSTFINALLGDSLLETGATPTTEAIEVVRYGKPKSEEPVQVGEYVREWRHPNTGSPGIAIVDTPGTGSVFRRHEEVAKEFLHRADLVIFVLSAKRAFAETERLYLELAQSFGKKIILIVNQIDLLDQDERGEVATFVRTQAKELLHLEPPMFLISAKEALSSDPKRRKQSGMSEVRHHLNRIFMDVPPAKQKLLSQLSLAERLADKASQKMDARLRLVGNDEEQAEQIRMELEEHAEQIDEQRDDALSEIARTFGNLRARGEDFINENLRLTKLGQALDRERLREKFESEVVGRAIDSIAALSNNYVNALVDGSRLYWRGVLDRLNQLDALVRAEVGAVGASTYADQRAVLQDAIYAAEERLRAYSDPVTVEMIREQFRGNLVRLGASGFFAVSGTLAVLINLAAAAGGAVAAPVAFILGVPAAIGGGVIATVYWRRMTNDAKERLNEQIDEIETTYKRTLNELTERERSRLLQYGQQVLSPVVSQLKVLSERYRQQNDKLNAFQDEIARLRDDIEQA